MHAIFRHPDSERIRRATDHYRLALASWKLGQETISLAHLWMATEALTKSRIRIVSKKEGVKSQAELAVKLGVELKELDATIRRDFILRGDEECYRKARKASDGLEHGYLSFYMIVEHAKDTRHRMAKYIRTEIFDQLSLSEDTLSVLTQTSYDEPMGYWPVVKYIRGKLLGEDKDLAPKENQYSFLKWKPVLTKYKLSEVGKLEVQINDKFTPELGEGISFKGESMEVWKPT